MTNAIVTDSLQATPDEMLDAYRDSLEFKTYLEDKARWESAHADYSKRVNPVTHNALVCAEHRMKTALRLARETSAHLSAFGW